MDVVTAGVSLSVVASTTAMINAVCVVALSRENAFECVSSSAVNVSF